MQSYFSLMALSATPMWQELKQEDAKACLRDRLHSAVHRAFNDDLMIGLAAALTGLVIFPMFITFSPAMLQVFRYVNYFIVAMFIAEYFLKVLVSQSKISFITNPWHILDLIIILIAAADIANPEFAPALIAAHGRISPVLRLPRLFLGLTLVGRSMERAVPDKTQQEDGNSGGRPEIAVLDQSSCIRRYSMADLELDASVLTSVKPLWIDMQNIHENDLKFVEEVTGIPRYILESKLIQESFPRIDFFKGFTIILLWDSIVDSPGSGKGSLNINTNEMLVICADTRIITLSTARSDIFDRILHNETPSGLDDITIGVLHSLLKLKVRDYGEIIQTIERRTIGFEEIPVNKTSPKFLEETFQFKKEIQKIISNLWHFNQVLDYMKVNKVALNGINDSHTPLFNILHMNRNICMRPPRISGRA